MPRKFVLLSMLPLVALAVLSGCPKKPVVEPDAAVLLVRGPANQLEAWQKAVDAYTEASKAKVSLQIEPEATYLTKLQSLIASGNAPDIAVLDATRFPEFVTSGKLEALDPLLEAQSDLKLSDYLPSAVHSFQYRGGTYGIPYDVSVLAVAYNMELFELAYVEQPPANWNWQDYLKCAKALTRDTDDNGTIDVWGTETPQWWQVNVWQNGGDVVDDVTNPQHSTLGTPAARQALQYLADLSLKEKVAPPASKSEAMRPVDAFCAGRIGMIVAPHGDMPQLNKASDLRWSALPLPRGKNAANLGLASGFCLLKGSKHQAEAWKLMKYLAGTDGQKVVLQGGITTPALEAMAQSEYFAGAGSTGKNPYVMGLKEAHSLPVTPRYAQISAIWEQELQSLWSGQATVQQVTERIDQRVNQVLQQAQPATAWLLPVMPKS